jgi:hypothetical protein
VDISIKNLKKYPIESYRMSTGGYVTHFSLKFWVKKVILNDLFPSHCYYIMGLHDPYGPTSTSYLGSPSENLKRENEKLLREREDWIFTCFRPRSNDTEEGKP